MQRGSVQVPPEGELHRADRDESGAGDVGDRDVLVGVLVDEGDRPAQRVGVGVVPVFNGGLGERVVREDGQHGGDQKLGRRGGN